MDSTGESQTASVRQSEPGLGEEVMDFAAQNRDEAALPGNCNAASTHAAADFSAPTETDRTEEGWQISQSLRAKKKQAKERKFQQGGDFSAGSRPTTDNQPKRRGRPTRRRPPALPKDDLKVVFRPHQGLPLKNVTTQAISDAIVEACQGKVRWDQFILRIRPGSNIALASTPDTTVAMAMRGVTSLNINGRPHPVNVYVTAGEGTKKGVIHGIEPHTPSETIKASIRFRTQSVTLVDARMLGDSQSAVLTFFGDILPRYVYYRGAPRWFQSRKRESEWEYETRRDPKEPFQNPHAVEKTVPWRQDNQDSGIQSRLRRREQSPRTIRTRKPFREQAPGRVLHIAPTGGRGDHHIIWCPAHEGLEGNVVADRIARGITNRATAGHDVEPLSNSRDILLQQRKQRKEYGLPHKDLDSQQSRDWRRIQTNSFPNLYHLSRIYPARYKDTCPWCSQVPTLSHITWECTQRPTHIDSPHITKQPHMFHRQWEEWLADEDKQSQIALLDQVQRAARASGALD
ncbi:hypothetical protein HPB51_016561 [Rhipicephalus microplus]|uniref:Tick transposon n=1 Tax=Rhipicephalus microplus TaxID=6941 RepID=A0A9J6EAV2_RHIMP|nr:hypothetical protein HPB51_016561 [Rhipicephalus microplus]